MPGKITQFYGDSFKFNKLGFGDLVLSLRRLVGFIGEDRLKELKRFLGDLIMHFSSNEVGVVIA